MSRELATGREVGHLDPYVSRAVLRRLASAPDALVQAIPGTIVMCGNPKRARVERRR